MVHRGMKNVAYYTRVNVFTFPLSVFDPTIGAVLCRHSSATAMKVSSLAYYISIWEEQIVKPDAP